jgi:thiol-disulfide isomerase/thioredoxin
MKNTKSWKYIVLCLVLGLFFNYNMPFAKGAEPISNSGGSHLKSNSFPEFQLPAPISEAEKNYLGLSDDGDFNIGQIKAKVLIIEFFSFYCPHCQNAASIVNEVYQKIEQQSAIKGKIKIIGLGVANSDYEINSFREKYKVPFPLFSDKSMEKFKLLRARATPTFIGINLNENGSNEQFYFKEGGFEDSQKFLDEIIKFSKIGSGDKNEPKDE